MVSRGWGKENRELFNGDRDSVLQERKSSGDGAGDGCTGMCVYLTLLNCTCEIVEVGNSMLCAFYHN